ncbi:hypothetical protein Hypma_016465 [Hypsizygus marmoreus]|uniref:F-box domain-containing protein n=1 Tax=Hypsizygus marmoreus TaxID=39966 RepID=A0A369J5C7_HYPMA|nr:hypothetical protein Hypma_016465 [Hypsizygus marmoreus]
MHNCLRIPEILGLICIDCIDWDCDDRPVLHKSLAALAETCRDFHEPALDTLWGDLNTLEPLIRCMPDDLWAKVDNTWTVTRAIRPTDWERFRNYARRVRKFSYNYYRRKERGISDEAFQVLSAATATNAQPLLPNVTEFNARQLDGSNGIIPFVHLFVGPRLITLRITSYEPTLATLSFVANINLWYPSLTTIGLIGFATSQAIAELSAAIPTWKQLRQLLVGKLSQPALKYLASLSTLERLHITSSFSLEPQVFFPTPCPSPTFRALRLLHIECRDHMFCINLLKLMAQATSLRDLRLECYGPPPKRFDWEILTGTLHDICLHPTIEDLCIKDTTGNRLGRSVNPNAVPLPFDVLMPLLPFTNLTSIDLFAEAGFDLDDSNLETLAKSWPRLTSFCIEGGPYRDIIPRPTSLSLVSFAHHCKDLEILTLAFDGRTVLPRSATVRGHNKSHPLRMLDIGCSPIVDPRAVGDLIYRLFPSIRIIHNVESDLKYGLDEEDLWSETKLEKDWLQVEKFIEAKQSAPQER